MDELLLSHHELRGAIRIAARTIIDLKRGQRNDPTVVLLLRVHRKARAVAQAYKEKAGNSEPGKA